MFALLLAFSRTPAQDPARRQQPRTGQHKSLIVIAITM